MNVIFWWFKCLNIRGSGLGLKDWCKDYFPLTFPIKKLTNKTNKQTKRRTLVASAQRCWTGEWMSFLPQSSPGICWIHSNDILSRTLPASRTNRTGWLPSRDRRFRAVIGCWRSADRRSGSLPREISRRPRETWRQPGTVKQIKLVITIARDWTIYELGFCLHWRSDRSAFETTLFRCHKKSSQDNRDK